jgi:hypothetical protein
MSNSEPSLILSNDDFRVAGELFGGSEGHLRHEILLSSRFVAGEPGGNPSSKFI